jgi:hypothetical protein
VQAVPGGADRTGLAPEVPAFTQADGSRKFKDYPDFVVNFQAQPGVGFLMGWRGKDGTESCEASRTRSSGRCTPRTTASSSTHAAGPAVHAQLEPALLDFAKDKVAAAE